MRKTTFGLGLAALLLVLPTPGRAQLHVGLEIGISFPEPPPLVVVTPGIQIVPEYEEEVYFVGTWYYIRREQTWYRTRDHRGGWRPVRVAHVPPALVRVPPGRYAHYYRDDDGGWRPHRRDEYVVWRDRNPHHERREWWHKHRHDRKIRLEHERAWREHDRRWREEERREREHRRAEQRREREERDRLARERAREERERRRGEHGRDPDHDHDRGRDDDHDRGQGRDHR